MTPICEEHGHLMEMVGEIRDKVTSLKVCLMGNMNEGKPGLLSRVKENEEFRIKAEARNTDLITHVYRSIIGIILVFIAVKVGMK